MKEGKVLQVWKGRHVELELKYLDGGTEQLSLDVVSENEADFDNGFLGENTPLAKAILGKSAGVVLPYEIGDIVQIRILSISPELHAQPKDLSQRREETTRQAVQDSDLTSTIIYASSMGNKWGEMDPGKLNKQDDKSS